jgi:E3 ubiquitin-protein ligase HECTD1
MGGILSRHMRRCVLLTGACLGLAIRPSSVQAQSAQQSLWDAAIDGDTTALANALGRGAAVDSLDTRQNPNGRRALNWAAWYNHPNAIRFLIAHGAHVNLANWTGFTPLHHAAEHGSLEAARVLLTLGADRTLLNGQGQRPVDVARERGHPDVAAVLDSLPRR